MSFEKITFNPKIWRFSYPWQLLKLNKRKIAWERKTFAWISSLLCFFAPPSSDPLVVASKNPYKHVSWFSSSDFSLELTKFRPSVLVSASVKKVSWSGKTFLAWSKNSRCSLERSRPSELHFAWGEILRCSGRAMVTTSAPYLHSYMYSPRRTFPCLGEYSFNFLALSFFLCRSFNLSLSSYFYSWKSQQLRLIEFFWLMN